MQIVSAKGLNTAGILPMLPAGPWRAPKGMRKSGSAQGCSRRRFKKTSIGAGKSAPVNAYLYRGPFFPRARGTRVKSPGGIAVEGTI